MQKLNSKGFTLIELLSVILILGIIALIAIPTINNIINQTKIGSNKATTENLVKAIETNCELEQLHGKSFTGIYSIDNAKKLVKGNVNATGTYEVDDSCNVSVALTYSDNNNYCYAKTADGDSIISYELDDTMTCLPEKKDATVESCFEYTEENNEITITWYKCGGNITGVSGDSVENLEITSYSEGTNMDVIIPNTIDGKKVTAIAQLAFVSVDGLTIESISFTKKVIINSVVIPSNVKQIGNYAFTYNKLNKITLNEGLLEIKDAAFGKNNISGTLVLPSTVTSLGNLAFTENNISTLSIGKDLTSIGSQAFSGNNITTLFINTPEITGSSFIENNITSLTLGDSVTTIGDSAFANNDITGALVIPDGVTTIGDSAFYNNKITSLILGENLKTIGESAFTNNNIIGTLVIPDNLTTMDYLAFSNNKITSLTLGKNVKTIGASAFSYNRINGELVIPNSVTTIGDYAFQCNDINTIKLGVNASNIGKSAFDSYYKEETNYSSNTNLRKIINNTDTIIDWNMVLQGRTVNSNSGKFKSGDFTIDPEGIESYVIKISVP